MTRRLRSALAATWLLVACLNPRPDELPGDVDDSAPENPGSPVSGPELGNGAAGTGTAPDNGAQVPTDQSPSDVPEPSGAAGAPPDAGVPGDAGVDAGAPPAAGGGAPSTNE